MISDSGSSLLVDTLFTVPLTEQMLGALRDACPGASTIDQVINTHANGDHCWGNQLVDGAEIISSHRAATEMLEFDPANMLKLLGLAKKASAWGNVRLPLARLAQRLGIETLGAVLEAAPYLIEIFGEFDFRGIRLVPPTRTFDDVLRLEVGTKRVELIEVGPAHSKGDLLVWVPEDGVVFTGDILFIDSHPVIWEGPIGNWIAACNRILELAPQAIVPGHGPLTDSRGVERVRDYLVFLESEATQRFEAGLSADEAAYDIAVGQFSHWRDAERVATNVDTIYRQLRGEGSRKSPVPCFLAMARYAERTGCRQVH